LPRHSPARNQTRDDKLSIARARDEEEAPDETAKAVFDVRSSSRCRTITNGRGLVMAMPLTAMINDTAGHAIQRDPPRFERFFVTEARYVLAAARAATVRASLVNRFPKLCRKSLRCHGGGTAFCHGRTSSGRFLDTQ